MTRTFHVYSKPNCGSCDRAKALLTRKGEVFTVVDVTTDAAALSFLQKRGFKSVPQIYLGTGDQGMRHIGGFTELDAFFKAGAE